MNIKLNKDEWEFLLCCWQHERSNSYKNYARDLECDIKLDLLNMYDDLLEKLGSEWKDDEAID